MPKYTYLTAPPKWKVADHCYNMGQNTDYLLLLLGYCAKPKLSPSIPRLWNQNYLLPLLGFRGKPKLPSAVASI
jgi:hypothetical protein